MSKEQLQEVADLIAANTLFCTKEVLTSDEAARYMGISKSYLYKLTMRARYPTTSRWAKCVTLTVPSWKRGYSKTDVPPPPRLPTEQTAMQ